MNMGPILSYLLGGKPTPEARRPTEEPTRVQEYPIDDVERNIFTSAHRVTNSPRVLSNQYQMKGVPRYDVRIIGLYGAPQCGKHTFIAEMDRELGQDVRVITIHFDDPITNSAAELLDMPISSFKEPSLRNKEYYDENTGVWYEVIDNQPSTPMEIHSWLKNTITAKYLGEKHLIHVMERKLSRILNTAHTSPVLVFVPDIKTLEEALVVRESGGKIIELFRPGLNYPFTESVPMLDTAIIDGHIINNKTKRDLIRKFKSIDSSSGCHIFSA